MVDNLVADGRFDYIETGSLISIRKNVEDIVIPSEEERVKLDPLDFEEYLWANDLEITPRRFATSEVYYMLSTIRFLLCMEGAQQHFKKWVEATGNWLSDNSRLFKRCA